MSFYSLLDDTVYIMTKTTTTNEWGEEISSYSSSSSAKCRIVPISEELKLTMPGEYKDVTHKAYFLPDTSISYNNKILYDGDEYRIRSIMKDSISHHTTVLLERIP